MTHKKTLLIQLPVMCQLQIVLLSVVAAICMMLPFGIDLILHCYSSKAALFWCHEKGRIILAMGALVPNLILLFSLLLGDMSNSMLNTMQICFIHSQILSFIIGTNIYSYQFYGKFKKNRILRSSLKLMNIGIIFSVPSYYISGIGYLIMNTLVFLLCFIGIFGIIYMILSFKSSSNEQIRILERNSYILCLNSILFVMISFLSLKIYILYYSNSMDIFYMLFTYLISICSVQLLVIQNHMLRTNAQKFKVRN